MKGRLFGKPFSAGNFLTTSFDSIPRFFFRLRTLRIKKKKEFTIHYFIFFTQDVYDKRSQDSDVANTVL